MKKLKNIIVCILAFVLFIPCLIISPIYVANAKDLNDVIDYKVAINAIMEDFLSTPDRFYRFPASKEEYNAALYIQEKMIEFGLEPVNNQSTKNGLQQFDVQTDSGVYSSQNVIFKKTGSNSQQKVVIATHYDAGFVYKVNDAGETVKLGSEGVAESAASVATMILLAQVLSFETFDFDIEFVFFGAHNNNLAGSEFYTSFLSSDDAKKIMLMINLDNIVSDGMIYLYNGELKNKTDDYVFSAFTKNLNARNMAGYNIISDTDTNSVSGLSYTNFALESDNAHFIRVGIKTLSPVVIPDAQVNALNIISYSPIVSIQKDTPENVMEVTGGKYLSNLSLVVNGCVNLLKDSEFKTNMSLANNSSLYGFWGNEKLMVFIAFILLIVICFVYSVVKFYLEKQAMKARNDLQLDKVIATISPSDLDDMDALMDRLEKQFEENAKNLEENQNEKNEAEKENNNSKVEDSNKKEDSTKKDSK